MPAELKRFNPTDPENEKRQVVIDGGWWGDDYQAVNQEFLDAGDRLTPRSWPASC